jgi:hypothetical protein
MEGAGEVKSHPYRLGDACCLKPPGRGGVVAGAARSKLHIGLPPLAMPRHELASDVLLEVLVRIARLKPAQVKCMLAIYIAEHM